MNVNDPTTSASGYGPADYESTTPQEHSAMDYMEEVDECVRRNPASAILVALGVGLLIGALIRTLQPQKPENRIAAMLGDIQHKLHQLSKPVYRGAARVAENSGDFVRGGVDRLGDMHLERRLKRWGKSLRNFLP
jgi:ElaB/YqjD/DUF883 family membrane-anchored ribosome-binding protein